ncbi:host-nuclease inhibitor Gam family protein [Candidatus Parcubacteria bacterium]|nr:host-nuclease inhibitor Gam family protein [Candidatus Parcubacteria bacterium]
MLQRVIASSLARQPESPEEANDILRGVGSVLKQIEEIEKESLEDEAKRKEALDGRLKPLVREYVRGVRTLSVYARKELGKVPKSPARQGLTFTSGELVRTVSQFIRVRRGAKEEEVLEAMYQSDTLRPFVRIIKELKKTELHETLKSREPQSRQVRGALAKAGVCLGKRTTLTIIPKDTVSQLVRRTGAITRENKKGKKQD